MADDTATFAAQRVAPAAVWVWLPATSHTVLRQMAGVRGASMPVLARQAAAAAVAAPGGRAGLPAPDDAAVESLRNVGYRLNGGVGALNEMLAAPRSSTTAAQYRAIAARLAPLLGEVADAARALVLDVPSGAQAQANDDGALTDPEGRWRKIMVTTDAVTLARWKVAADAAGFTSMPNWIRDAMAGAYQLAIPRPPALVTIQVRALVGRIGGLVAQVQLAADQIAVIDRLCSGLAETVSTVLAEVLESLVMYGGDIKARR
ncbi:hypothetical protein IUS38_24765 [Mycobacteroides abscessus subsp. abscessus]|uniref:hypothetical protein n=1 Tax=Mycobacteroides abscessus TaxID=36809 RepID=UPI0019D31F9A|nr:hypothetical protein [Mycobacteroides abscessus]MBN7438798.1 hypothetical protein [Mycobacteroides abscessus subsp. abscessus]